MSSMQDVVVVLVTAGQRSITCPFYDELDEVLRHRPSFYPMDGYVLDFADSNISSSTDTTVNMTGKSLEVITESDVGSYASGQLVMMVMCLSCPHVLVAL